VKQVVRSLGSWMQTLIPTSAGKPTRRKGSVRLKTNAGECLELRALPAALIGVDFGPANGSPRNWKNFGATINGTVANLTDESGVASKVSLNIQYADGQGSGVSSTIVASQLPKHSQSLAGLNGAIRDDSKITLTFNNLTPSGVYEVYVFGGSTQADTQNITLAGSGQSQKFSQILDSGKLVVNGLAGSSGKDLSTYARTVTATSSGHITISAEGIELPECSLAGVAIRPVLSDIQLNSVKSNGESTLTVKYTIKDAAARPFRIAAYESEDTLFSAANDKLAGFVQISDAADLTPGLHTKVYQIGQQIKLPYAGTAATKTDYLLFVADDNKLAIEEDKDALNEDNKTVFSGAYGAYTGVPFLAIFGSSGADKITLVNEGQTFKVSSVDVNRSYTTSKVNQVIVHAVDGNDQVLASSLTVQIAAYGGTGIDRLVGGTGYDVLDGGDGIDTLEGGDGNDKLFGGNETDLLKGGAGDDLLTGDDGDDTLDGGAGGDRMLGGRGSDVYEFGIASSSEVETVIEKAEPGIDTLDFSRIGASAQLSVILDPTGRGIIFARQTNRTLQGDSIDSTKNLENVVGSPGDDSIFGNAADNRLESRNGNDLLVGRAGNDFLSGGIGDDVIYGEPGNDTLEGAEGNDVLFGNDGNDTLSGFFGNDILVGGPGADTLDGGGGEDIMTAGIANAFDTEAGKLAVIKEWASSKTLLQKVAQLRSGVGTPKVSLQRGVNVKNDGSKDVLRKGGTGIDWVFYSAVDDTFTSGAGDILELL
jgi:Ca2+-binding RTX toxin-like protein